MVSIPVQQIYDAEFWQLVVKVIVIVIFEL